MKRARATIAERLERACACCGKKIHVVVYRDRSYRGGHNFGTTPLISKKEMDKSHRAGTHPSKIFSVKIKVLNRDPKPYGYAEYWECAQCYWHGKNITPLRFLKSPENLTSSPSKRRRSRRARKNK